MTKFTNIDQFVRADYRLVSPDKKSCYKYSIYGQGRVYLSNATREEYVIYCRDNNLPQCEDALKAHGFLVQEVFDQDYWQQLKSQYIVAHQQLMNDFRDYLFIRYNVEDCPKRFKCFEIAQHYMIGKTIKELANYFATLTPLIR